MGATSIELLVPVTWIAWGGKNRVHALKEPDHIRTLCGVLLPSKPPIGSPQVVSPHTQTLLWQDREQIVWHKAVPAVAARCSHCNRIAGDKAEPSMPLSGRISEAASELLDQIEDWHDEEGHCAFHELSHYWTRAHYEGFGYLLRELKEAGAIVNGHDRSGLISTLVPADEATLRRVRGFGSRVTVAESVRARPSMFAQILRVQPSVTPIFA